MEKRLEIGGHAQMVEAHEKTRKVILHLDEVCEGANDMRLPNIRVELSEVEGYLTNAYMDTGGLVRMAVLRCRLLARHLSESAWLHEKGSKLDAAQLYGRIALAIEIAEAIHERDEQEAE